jgi:hypothetical protein
VVYAVVNNLIDERCWKVVFGTGVIEIAKVHAYTDGALCFVNRDRFGDA